MHVDRSDPTVRTIVERTFPEYNGKRISISPAETIAFYGTLWDGGTRYRYRLYDLASQRAVAVPPEEYLAPDAAHRDNFAIPPNIVVVRKQDGYREYVDLICLPGTLVPALPPPVDIADDERIVLRFTASYKSSYGGISNYRFHEANRTNGITAARWEAAKATLIGKGLLDKRGALTLAGKNAAL